MKSSVLFLCFALTTPVLAADRTPEQQAAVELFNQRRNPEAKAAFEKIAAANPSDADAQRHLGLLALRADDPKTAVQHLERAVALAPGSSQYQTDLGDAYGRTAQKASIFTKMSWAGKCRTAYEKAVSLDPSNLDARQSLMTYYKEAPGIAGGSKEKAYAQAEEMLRLDSARGRAAKASLLVDDKKYSEAFALYEQSLAGGARDYASLFAIGRLAAITGERVDRGIETLRQALTLQPPPNTPGHPAAHWRLGNLLEKKGDKAAARTEYQASLKLDPKFEPAQKSLAALH